ncbi:hypothetical protein HNP82_003219 [Catenibacillus scindens]|uniref:Uncharacterized protein n=1 Tax=Catenibacillus scindens TaxID=673271 RepID=A0A7W8M6G4_9FIRM|nr:hypothetical protein [Catenibacillus scindens]MBB5266065.1 hypothetical protein [Catenibacillus scindens]
MISSISPSAADADSELLSEAAVLLSEFVSDAVLAEELLLSLFPHPVTAAAIMLKDNK